MLLKLYLVISCIIYFYIKCIVRILRYCINLCQIFYVN